MTSHYLLDTHILIWWLEEPRKLSRQQTRVIEDAERLQRTVGVSSITLLELAVLDNRRSLRADVKEVLEALRNNPLFEIIPFTLDIAAETAGLTSFRDPADRAIVATALVRRLKLLTADEDIIESNLVSVVD